MPTYSATYDIPSTLQDTINTHTVGMGGVGIVGGLFGPGFDIPAIAASWVTLTIQIAKETGHDIDADTVKKLTAAVATGAGSFYLGTKVAATAGGWVGAAFTGGLSLLVMAAGNAALNAAFTQAYGKACARYFLQADEIDTFDVIVKVIIHMMAHTAGIAVINEIVTETIELEMQSRSS
jgi:hypothetical protein